MLEAQYYMSWLNSKENKKKNVHIKLYSFSSINLVCCNFYLYVQFLQKPPTKFDKKIYIVKSQKKKKKSFTNLNKISNLAQY